MTGGTELLIEVSPGEARAARREDGRVVELYVERASSEPGPGDLYLGRVKKLLRNANGAFVDLGAAEAYLSGKDAGWAFDPRSETPPSAKRTDKRIETLVTEGAWLVLTVKQAARGDKAATVTTHVDAAARASVVDAARAMTKPGALTAPATLVERLLGGRIRPPVDNVRLDGSDAVDAVRRALAAPPWRCVDRLDVHRAAEPLFAVEDVDEAFDAALDPRVPLVGGGSLVIEPTEALVAIDVDTGDRGERDKAGAVRAVNLAAAAAIAAQIRLRNLSGLIVVDFVHMRGKADRQATVDALREAVRDDPSEVEVGGMTRFGLVELVRRRQWPSLAEQLLDRPAGTGVVPSVETVALQALRAVLRQACRNPAGAPCIRAAPSVVAILKDRLSAALGEAESAVARPIALEAAEGRGRDFFDITFD